MTADPERAVAAIFAALEGAGATVLALRDPAVLPKAIKNAAEIAGSRAAHARDGAALTRFLHWLSLEAPQVGIDELSAQAKLHEFREETGALRDLSFDTISGAGPNGAVVHYRASEETNRPLEIGSLYLVDSGGQYQDGTTDVTRTIAIGTPTAEMRDRFTACSRATSRLPARFFPRARAAASSIRSRANICGRLASIMRMAPATASAASWRCTKGRSGSRRADRASRAGTRPLRAGMMLSNEPGYYKAHEYGIRIENLVLIERARVAGAEQALLGFETLTFAPIDRALIEVSLLDAAERAWIDAYHAAVQAKIAPLVDDDVRTWPQGADRAFA